LPAGRHIIVATRLGYQPAILNVDVIAEREVQARVQLEAEVASIPAVTEPPPPSAAARGHEQSRGQDATMPPSHGSELVRPFALGAAGLGVAMLGVGAVIGLQANALNDDSNADGRCDTSGCDDVGVRLRYAAMRKGDLATGLFIAGGTLVAAGASFYFLFPTKTRGAPGVRVSARSGATDVSVGMRFD
jgi:hypothetical protein